MIHRHLADPTEAAVAFAMLADADNLTFEAGLRRAEAIAEAILSAAEGREGYAPLEESQP